MIMLFHIFTLARLTSSKSFLTIIDGYFILFQVLKSPLFTFIKMEIVIAITMILEDRLISKPYSNHADVYVTNVGR